MYGHLFTGFLASRDNLRVYRDKELLFASREDGLRPLLKYIDRSANYPPAVIFDRVMGNAAALLAIKAGCREVCSPVGSQLAVETLQKYGIKYYLTVTVRLIQKPDGCEMCPMEELSVNKEPEEFYRIARNLAGFPEGGRQW